MSSESRPQVNNVNVAIIVVFTVIVAFFALNVLSQRDTTSASGSRNNVQGEQDNINEEDTMEEIVQDVDQLSVEMIKEGDGEVTKVGDTISVHYTGTLLNGSQFDSSKGRGTPFEFTLGEGSVIEGWDVGLVGIKAGSTVKLTIPSDMGYGEYGRPPQIPGGSALVFEVDIIEIK